MENVTEIKRGLKFYGAEGDWDVYRYYKGGRAIFEAAVDRTDPELKIYVGKVNAVWAKVNEITDDSSFDSTLFETKGRAYRKSDDDRISGMSVIRYIRPRAFSILANLYVKPVKPVDIPYIPPTN